jgi:type I restriction enzyme S subunit
VSEVAIAARPGWETKRLDEVADILDNRRIPVNSKERDSRQGTVPYFGATGQVGWIDDHIFDEEIVLLGEDGAPFLDSTKQKAYVVRGKSWVNNHAHVLRAKEGIPSLYLKYWLDRLDYRPYVNGTTRLKLTQGEMRRIPILLPPEGERYEIVAEIEKQFSRLDEAVANLQRVKANLKRYKASVLKDAVEGRLVPTEAELARREGRTFETGEQLLQRILAERRAKWSGKGKYKEPVAQTAEFSIAVPDGWTSATVDQLGSVQLGKMLDKQKHTAGAPYRYLRNINVRWGTFDLSDVFEMNFEPDELERFSVRAGDVLVCEGGEPARAAVWRSKQTDMKYQKALHRVRFDGAYLPDLLVIALEHLAKSGALDELYGGSTIKHFTREAFVKLVLPVPPAAEQARIVAEVDRHLSIIREVEAEVDANLQRTQALRQATLSRAFASQGTLK